MVEKRFYLNEGEVGILKILDLKEDNEAIYHTASKSDMKMVVELLNELNDECEFLEIENESLEDGATKYVKLYHKSLKENEQLKQVLGSILIEVRRDISATNHSGEVKAFVNPNSFELISEVLKKYGALKDWYE